MYSGCNFYSQNGLVGGLQAYNGPNFDNYFIHHLKNVLPLVQNDNYSEPKLVCRQLFSNVYEDIESVYTFFQFLSQQISK